MTSPVVLFVYNRADHCEKVLFALEKCRMANETHLFIFSDGPKTEKQIENVTAVRDYLENYDKSKFLDVTIFSADKNKGLANSIITGVGTVMEQYGKVIVIEDDTVPMPNFLEYMNQCLETYKDDDRIWAIGGYLIPVNIPESFKDDIFLSRRGSSCAWATWADRWNKVDWDCRDYPKFHYNLLDRHRFNRAGQDISLLLDHQMAGRVDSWAIRFEYACYRNNQAWIMPRISKALNIGFDSSGTHSGSTDLYDDVVVNADESSLDLSHVEFHEDASKKLIDKYKVGVVKRLIVILILNKYKKKIKKIYHKRPAGK